MADETKAPPAGLLAGKVLKDAAVEPVPVPEASLADTPSPAIRPTDPAYREPTALTAFREMHEKISREACDVVSADGAATVLLERKVLIDYLLGRIDVLETALRPFCVTGTMMSNALMCLAATGSSDPAGGTWISNPPNGIQLQPTAGYFFNAVDALGRKATEDHMAAIFARVQEANALQEAKRKHVEAGGTVH